MKRALALVLLLAACQREPEKEKPQWRFVSRSYGPSVSYRFGDAENMSLPNAQETVFAGRCDTAPIFLVVGGDYPLGSPRFVLFVDDKSWSFDTFQGEHGRALFIDEPEVVGALRDATRRIAFQVGGWRRELKPSPLVRRFVDECLARRKAEH